MSGGIAVAVADRTVLLWDDPERPPHAGIVFPMVPNALAWGPEGELAVGFGRDVAVLRRSGG
ncbi:hypothetical protein HS041_28560 [Planomonospora sp. ID67723]|uniref:hypothetical protein n=1 Tax=Planomonospora sp. ID67723 TaxID=2738134 RepID=UPI0018C3CAC9|nr:hypothetical protein [Planomonospora sp. ID67723]MBG0831684.1 hypothetical protein [Planomonospora sp. ID67723]